MYYSFQILRIQTPKVRARAVCNSPALHIPLRHRGHLTQGHQVLQVLLVVTQVASLTPRHPTIPYHVLL